MLKLIGIVIIVIGFVIKFDTLAVVITAGIATGLASGMGFNEVIEILGAAFVKNRYMSIFFLTLPLIGMLERYGLRERAAYLIGKIKSATAGRILALYMVIRTMVAAFGIRLGGHIQFIRPLILPMARGAEEGSFTNLDEKDAESLKGVSGAVENYGNFFGQNGFVAAGGVLLIVATLQENGITVEAVDIAKASIPMAIIAVVVASIQFLLRDKKLRKKGGK